MLHRLAVPALLGAASIAGIFAPISLTRSSGLAPADAQCATCCPQKDATCVICGTEECVSHPGYYEGKSGADPCGIDQT